MTSLILSIISLCSALMLTAGEARAEDDKAQAGAVLDTLHTAAAQADAQTYFDQFSEDAMFLGTDAGERWTISGFREFAMPYFEKGEAWTYVPQERHVVIGANGQTAWFDELLHNDKYGLTRGSGTLVKTGDGWKIAQYHLTFPIPNDIAVEVTERLEAWRQAHSDRE